MLFELIHEGFSRVKLATSLPFKVRSVGYSYHHTAYKHCQRYRVIRHRQNWLQPLSTRFGGIGFAQAARP